QPIAHGLLVFSMASGLGSFAPPMRTLAVVAIRDWSFREPVFIGDTIRVRTKIVEKQTSRRGKRGVVTWQRQILNQHGNGVQEGVTVTPVEGRGQEPGPGNASQAADDTERE